LVEQATNCLELLDRSRFGPAGEFEDWPPWQEAVTGLDGCAFDISRRVLAGELGCQWTASNVAYRQTRKFAQSAEAISAWVRETELTAEQMETAPFDEAKLRASIGELRRLTREKADSILNPVQSICAGFGVAVVLVPELPHCGLAVLDKKALIGLTLRYKTDDQLWFTFFHELPIFSFIGGRRH
jgi:hypothetical protein